jgi:hypothetical protein
MRVRTSSFIIVSQNGYNVSSAVLREASAWRARFWVALYLTRGMYASMPWYPRSLEGCCYKRGWKCAIDLVEFCSKECAYALSMVRRAAKIGSERLSLDSRSNPTDLDSARLAEPSSSAGRPQADLFTLFTNIQLSSLGMRLPLSDIRD